MASPLSDHDELHLAALAPALAQPLRAALSGPDPSGWAGTTALLARAAELTLRRQRDSTPVIQDIEQLLLANLHSVLPQSLLGKALHYTAGQWHKLKRYVDDGSGNVVDRAKTFRIFDKPAENRLMITPSLGDAVGIGAVRGLTLMDSDSPIVVYKDAAVDWLRTTGRTCTVVDAYLSPILRRYVAQVEGALDMGRATGRLLFMQSNGGLTDAATFQGKDSILSGPAGGIVGAVETAKQAGFTQIIGFDMGGTSTDVSHFNGAFERSYEAQVAGVRMRTPMMLIHTVAAGGGSILHFDGSRYRVGPDSSGAVPGPACYRRGGPLSVTDANLLLGKLQPAYFPQVFGPGADEALDAQAVRRGLASAELPGRFQIIAGQPPVILDVAHNPHSIAALAANLDAQGYYPCTHAVFGVMADKEYASMLAKLNPIIDRWYFCDLPTPRAAQAETVQTQWQAQNPRKDSTSSCYPNPQAALDAAFATAAPDDRIVVFGSFFTVGGVLEHGEPRPPAPHLPSS